MTRDELIRVLNEAKSENQSEDFVFEINPSDMRSVLARLRHMEAKGIVTDYWRVDDRRVEVLGYGG